MQKVSSSPEGLFKYSNVSVAPVPNEWKVECRQSFSTLHQLSPYIGKLKSSLAHELVLNFSKPGDLVADPFSGSGTVPLESAMLNRSVFASDISPYAMVLSKAKLFPSATEEEALELADQLLYQAGSLPSPDLRKVPLWIRKFFHPKTLKEIIKFAEVCKSSENNFLFACLLGILHHQRPGFLSYPSSHLVPYLRNKNFPRDQYPELYEYRALNSRLLKKVKRAYKHSLINNIQCSKEFTQCSLENVVFPEKIDCLITSPPYMNALDYGRDNRIRLWFIEPDAPRLVDTNISQNKKGFDLLMSILAQKTEISLKDKGHAVIVVGEKVDRSSAKKLSEIVYDNFLKYAPSLKLKQILYDEIPDIRRSRKNCRRVKSENFMIFRKN